MTDYLDTLDAGTYPLVIDSWGQLKREDYPLLTYEMMAVFRHDAGLPYDGKVFQRLFVLGTPTDPDGDRLSTAQTLPAYREIRDILLATDCRNRELSVWNQLESTCGKHVEVTIADDGTVTFSPTGSLPETPDVFEEEAP